MTLLSEIADLLEAEARLTLSRAPMLRVPQKAEQERAEQMRAYANKIKGLVHS